MSAVICRFEGCVNTGSRATFSQDGQERETLLCSGHTKAVYDALHDPTKVVVTDATGRIRVAKAPPLHDHESEPLPNIIGVLDVVAERELKLHVIEPHGTWGSDMRAFMCIPCSASLKDATALIAHLDSAVDTAIDKALKAVQQSKE